MIYKPATGTGAKVMDPNSDGYLSMTRSGFSGTSDEGVGISEIPYRPFPALTTEPISDLNTGSSGGHTDLATPTEGDAFTGSPVAAYFDGANLMFRLRLGSSSTASKGYSVLIDSDGKFDSPGNNPGFEYEVLLASNFAVQVIKHTPTGSTAIFTGSVDQYSQRAVAASTSGSNADYFYDFYVPLSAFNGGITASTPLRMSGITVTSAQSGLTGTVSDVGGVNFLSYNYDAPAAWRALIGVFPATSLTTLQTSAFPKVAATAPVVNSPIQANSTSISGSSVEAAGSTITVYRTVGTGSPVAIGTTTVSSNGSWTLSGLSSSLLAAGNVITATVTVSGKSLSASSNAVTVSAGICTATPAPKLTGITGTTGNRALVLTPSFSGNQVITVYNLTSGTSQASVVLNLTAGTPYPSSSTTAPASFVVAQNNNYVVTATPTDAAGNPIGCTSLRSNQLCYTTGGNFSSNPHTVTITGVTYNSVSNTTSAPNNTEVPTNLSAVTVSINFNGSLDAGNLVLFRNGVQTNISAPYTIGTTTQTLSLAGLSPALTVGDVLSVRTIQTAGCAGQSTPSNFLTVLPTSAAPVINTPNCGLVTTLSGTSSEAVGTVIQFYTGGVAGDRSGTLVVQNGTTTPITASVNSNGTWEAYFTTASGGGIPAGTAITARAKASGKVRSVNSNVVSAVAGPTGVLTINRPIIEGSTSISGTGPASSIGAKVTLYLEGTPFTTTVLVASDGTWKVEGISAQELFAGANVSATYTPTSQCESMKSAIVTVSCSAPAVTYTMTPSETQTCGGNTVNFTLSGSTYGISYRLLANGVESGASVIGTGGPITLTSAVLTNLTASNQTVTFTYRARKVGGSACDATSTGTVAITVRPQPITSGLAFTSTTGSTCANSSASILLNGTSTTYTYQLMNQTTNTLVGSPVTGVASGSITLSTGIVTANTTYGLAITFASGTTPCSTTLANQVSVTVTGAPTNTAVYAAYDQVCANGSTPIYVATLNNAGYQYKVYRKKTAANGLGADALLGTLTGNGATQSVSSGSLATAGTEEFYVTVTSASCGTVTLTMTAQVQVSSTPELADAGADKTFCGSSTVLNGNSIAASTGMWTQISGPSVATFSSASDTDATVGGLVSGAYVFRWTVQTTCGGSYSQSADDVKITINCDASYTLAIPKYKDEYAGGEILARATDPDGPITTASITQGALPAGIFFNAANGNLSVANPGGLIEGIYPLTIRLVDAAGGTTVTDIVLRIYGNSPSIVPLPVELVYFRATAQQYSVELKWLTASEENNQEFVIERSVDGKNYIPIGTVTGAGSTTLSQLYTFTDSEVPAGIVYYRLKQIDYDGQFNYSKVVSIRLKETIAQGKQLNVWPNPFEEELHVEVYAPVANEVSLVVSDLKGRIIYQRSVQLKMGTNKLNLSLQELSTGVYLLHLQGTDITGKAKVIKH
ncbi:T9SS type A sorting domain-containing protein [Pontibacter anaerobius]|uniref:T9SS type A sorting domain-containing protein n=1 Tax=Pontibacter anaerobius TaxID=2993940 RepID=A0ABT3RH96_9BACT|nr:T9SS type A sorting domain-containing protein [Pontibacter anaerobius]MCX2741004.1 T9SS type A sorting domain-containing protein [Pontibacter anaerobius]